MKNPSGPWELQKGATTCADEAGRSGQGQGGETFPSPGEENCHFKVCLFVRGVEQSVI